MLATLVFYISIYHVSIVFIRHVFKHHPHSHISNTKLKIQSKLQPRVERLAATTSPYPSIKTVSARVGVVLGCFAGRRSGQSARARAARVGGARVSLRRPSWSVPGRPRPAAVPSARIDRQVSRVSGPADGHVSGAAVRARRAARPAARVHRLLSAGAASGRRGLRGRLLRQAEGLQAGAGRPRRPAGEGADPRRLDHLGRGR